jgi:hypothetical protein
MAVRDWNGGLHHLTDEVYFHWTDDFSILCHNAKLGQGLTMSVSALAASTGVDGFSTPYAAMNSEKEKEAAWEATRIANFKHQPSRNRAFFCFSSKDAAETARTRWFPKSSKRLLEVRMTSNTVVFSADSQWLDCIRSEWDSASHNYWMGLETSDPLLETIACGAMYFPEWQTFSSLGS